MDDHVLCEVVDGPLAERLEDVLMDAHVDRVVLVAPLVGVIIGLAGSSLILTILTVSHVHVRVGIVALERMLGIRLKQAPTGRAADIDVVLAPVFVILAVGAMYANDISDLPHDRTILEPVRVDNDHGKGELFVDFIAFCVQTAVDDFERADPLALAALHWVGRVDDHTIDVQLVVLLRVEWVILDLCVT